MQHSLTEYKGVVTENFEDVQIVFEISEIQKCIKLKKLQVSEHKYDFIEGYIFTKILGFSIIIKSSTVYGNVPSCLNVNWAHSRLHLGYKNNFHA